MGEALGIESDMNPPQLLKTPLPRVDESLMGYMIRLTEENVYLSPSWIFELAGLKVGIREGGWPTLYRRDLDSSGLEHVTGLEKQEIDRLRYQIRDTYKTICINGNLIDKRFVRNCLPKVCPLCLKQFGYCQYIWDLLPITACPFHETMLIDKCPGCQKRISWVRGSVCKCRCGADWREGESIQVDQSELELASYIYELLGIKSVNNHLFDRKENPLYRLDLNDLIRVLTLMADYYLLLSKSEHITTKTENSLCHLAYSFATSIFENWPRNYFGFLELVRKHEGYPGIINFHKDVSEQCEAPSLLFILAALEKFIEKTSDMAQDSGDLSLSVKRQFIDKRDACLRLNISEDWLDILISQGKVETYCDDGSENLIYLPSLDILKWKISHLMIYWTAADFLGVRSGDVIDLIHDGCLRALSGPDIDGFGEWAVDATEVTSLMRKIETKIVHKESPAADTVAYGWEVLKYLKQYGLSAGKFIVDMLNDEINPVGEVRGEGITKFLFLKDQVIKYRQNLQPEDLPIDAFNYRQKFLEKLEQQKAIQIRWTVGERRKLSQLLRALTQLLDKEWARNDLVYTNRGIESFSITDLVRTAKHLFGVKDLS